MYATRLSPDSILAAAIELIEADGVASLTMRSLANRCDASPMGLYRHFATKEDLMRAVADRYLAEVELPKTDDLPWRETIVAVAGAIHRAFLAHPHLPEILAVQHIDAIAIFRGSEVILRALRDAGLDDREAVGTLDTITSYAAGYTQRKAEMRKRATAQDERLRRIRELPREEFGTVVELAGQLVTLDFEHEFEDGLELVLDGVERRISRSAA